ncbi:MAG: tetratricopeptide repeat protein [Gammaproteobacteria bacterium]|nr:tetratricopeptide repeat protein [Gammaproteobacteria bacterium]
MRKKKASKPPKRGLPTCVDKSEPQLPRGVLHDTSLIFAQVMELHRLSRFEQAKFLCEKIIALNGGHIDALNYLGTVHLQNGSLREGIRLIGKSLEVNSAQPVAHMNQGNAFKDLGDMEEAFVCYSRAIALKANFPEVYYCRGNAYSVCVRLDEALADYDRAIALRPDYVQAIFNRGNTLKSMGRLDEALASYDRAIALKPDYAEAYYNRGYVLNDLKRIDEALLNCDRVIALMPNFADAHYNRGNALQELGRLDEAVISYDHAVALKPSYFEAFSNRGNALRKLKCLDDALASYQRAIALNPAYASAHNNQGNVLLELNRYEAALESYGKAITIEPDLPYVLGSWLHSKMCCCDWGGIEAAYGRIASALERGERVSTPFFFLPTPSTPDQQLCCAELYAQDKFPSTGKTVWHERNVAHERIKVGYFSSDFRSHAMAYLIAEMIERHDRSKFEIIAFSFSPPTDAPIRRRLEKAFDRFIDVSAETNREIVARARQLEIDIAIDLNGFTLNSRTEIFASRLAPIQVNHLGYPGTMGAEYMDYIIADETVIPPGHREYFSERVAYLPDTYWFNDSTNFVFCCFNNSYKITPDLFDIWMRLLHVVGGSVLWLLEGSAIAAGNLRLEAERRGISVDRLIFAPRMEMTDHLARHRHADLFLDTFYYNAHTTTSDALWAGLPVLTCLGKAFAGRVAASLLNAIDLPEMISYSHAEYESRAIELATKPELLCAIRQKLAVHRSTKPLFDTERFTRHIEAAYTKMYERYQAGLSPDHIIVEA